MDVFCRSHRLGKDLSAALALASGVLLAAPADANFEPLPPVYLSLSSYQPNPERVATQHAQKLIESERQASSSVRPAKRYRARNFKVLDYKTQVKVIRKDVFVRMKSPGPRSSILMLELTF